MKLDKIKKLNLKQLNDLKMKSETTIQIEIVNWFRMNIDGVIFSVPNEATRNNSKFKDMGVLSGVSDLIVVTMCKCMFIELKDHKGTQSQKQKTFQSDIEKLGFEYKLIRSLDEFKIAIRS